MIADSWLQRSGQAWKMQLTEVSTFVMIALFGIAFTFPKLFLYLVTLGFGFGLLNVVLPILVQCQVCGLRVNGSDTARRLWRGERLLWLYGLQACPRCGDEGLALPEAREAWKQQQWIPEPPYWNARRIGFAILAICVLLVVVDLLGRFDRAGP